MATEKSRSNVPQQGTFKLKIIDCEEKPGKKGPPYLRWRLKIIDEGIYKGTFLYTNTMLSGKWSCFLVKLLKAADPSYDGGDFDPEDYFNKVVLGELTPSKKSNEKYIHPDIKIRPLVPLKKYKRKYKGAQS